MLKLLEVNLLGTKHNDQLSVGLLAQSVKHSTSVIEVMGLTPLQAWLFSGFIFTTAYYVV